MKISLLKIGNSSIESLELFLTYVQNLKSCFCVLDLSKTYSLKGLHYTSENNYKTI